MLFNQDTSVYAEPDEVFNLHFVRSNQVYLNELLRARGYVYMNQIYEILGFGWDPERENRCYIYKQGDRFIDLGIENTRNGLELMHI